MARWIGRSSGRLLAILIDRHVDRSIDKPDNFIKSNFLGVYNLLESISFYKKKNKKKIKLVHVSTDEVYGDVLKGRSDENFPYNPSSPYSATKAGADHLIKSYIIPFSLTLPLLIVICFIAPSTKSYKIVAIS